MTKYILAHCLYSCVSTVVGEAIYYTYIYCPCELRGRGLLSEIAITSYCTRTQKYLRNSAKKGTRKQPYIGA